LNKLLDEYVTINPPSKWQPAANKARSQSSLKADSTADFPQLAGYLTKYQDPSQADSIMRVQQELDETKIILHKTIEEVLERGEKVR